jgi:muramoyltetrapeptide carboxypeptidase
LPLNVPVLRGAQFGHIKKKWTLPIGLPVEMDAAAATLRLLSAAVA